jgi:hypothetical protein
VTKEVTIEDDREHVELFTLIRALLKRVEALEKLTGISRQAEVPCVYCNVLGNHQSWCQKDAKRV